MYLGSVAIAVTLFVLALKRKGRPVPAGLIIVSQSSTVIYLILVLIGYSLEGLVAADSLLQRNIFPIFVCILSTLAAQLIGYVKNAARRPDANKVAVKGKSR